MSEIKFAFIKLKARETFRYRICLLETVRRTCLYAHAKEITGEHFGEGQNDIAHI